MVYITSRRFNERTDPGTLIKVYSNCEQVELKINGMNIGKMSKYPMNIFKKTDIILKKGSNVIEAGGLIKGRNIRDECEWTLL